MQNISSKFFHLAFNFFPKVILITDWVQKLIIQFLRFQETKTNFLLISIIWLIHHAPEAAAANTLVSAITGLTHQRTCTINLLNISPAGIHRLGRTICTSFTQDQSAANPPCIPTRISTLMPAQKQFKSPQCRCCVCNGAKLQTLPLSWTGHFWVTLYPPC